MRFSFLSKLAGLASVVSVFCAGLAFGQNLAKAAAARLTSPRRTSMLPLTPGYSMLRPAARWPFRPRPSPTRPPHRPASTGGKAANRVHPSTWTISQATLRRVSKAGDCGFRWLRQLEGHPGRRLAEQWHQRGPELWHAPGPGQRLDGHRISDRRQRRRVQLVGHRFSPDESITSRSRKASSRTACSARRTKTRSGARAVVQDWMFNSNFSVFAQNPTLSQWRGQLGYAVNAWNEIGIWGTWRGHGDERNIGGFGPTSWRAVNQLSVFVHHKWGLGGADTSLWVGVPEHDRLGGNGSLGDYLIGLSANVPLNDRVGLVHARSRTCTPRHPRVRRVSTKKLGISPSAWLSTRPAMPDRIPSPANAGCRCCQWPTTACSWSTRIALSDSGGFPSPRRCRFSPTRASCWTGWLPFSRMAVPTSTLAKL